MVFFDEHDHGDEPLDDERSMNPQQEAADVPDLPSASSQTCPQLFVEVRGHGHGLPVQINLGVSHSISSLAREADSGRRLTSSTAIPARSVASLRSMFDLAGPSSTFGHGRELGGRSSVLALQVPASSLPPPLTASAIVDSFQIRASGAFLSPLSCGEEASPSTRESLPCMPCQASQIPHSDSASSSRNNDRVNSEVETPYSRAIGQGGVVRRLTEVLQGRADEDLVFHSSNKDNIMSQWLQALDVHVLGACRADERLQPMLRWNASYSGADGHLLAHLSQHFKVKELGLLARCLCAPLVSIRVGKTQRQGRFLCPTASRGYLSLTMLPCSEMRLSYVGDSGVIERIAAIKPVIEETHVVLEMISDDPSGRSFILKLSGGKHFFWQSENSRIVGDELIAEMKDFLLRRPTLSQLTGVHETRLNSFVCQLRNNLAATSVSTPSCTSSIPLTDAVAASSSPSPCGIRQSPRLSPRASGFKEGASRALTNVRSIISTREKHRRRLDKLNPSNALSLSNFANIDMNSDLTCGSQPFQSISQEERVNTHSNIAGSSSSLFVPELCRLMCNDGVPCPKQVFNVPLTPCSLPSSSSLIPSMLTGSSFSSGGLHLPIPSHLPVPSSTLFTPYYCPCPLRSSALQCTITPPFLPPVGELNNGSSSSPSFFSVKPSSAILAQTTISLDRVSISPIPLPVSSLVNIPTPLRTSSLSSFFSDPIVHIPVVDFQSVNKSFLVSAPPSATSSGIPTVLPSFLSNILSGGERSGDGQEVPGLNLFQGLGIPCQADDECREHGGVQPFLIDSRLLTRCSDDRTSRGGPEEVKDSYRFSSSESLRSFDLDMIPKFSGPLLGMVPAILSTGSLSCVLNFCPERSTTASPWVSGSRGLYGGSCEPGIPAPAVTTCSTSLNVRIRGSDILQTLADTMDSFISGSPKDAEEGPTEEETSKKD